MRENPMWYSIKIHHCLKWLLCNSITWVWELCSRWSRVSTTDWQIIILGHHHDHKSPPLFPPPFPLPLSSSSFPSLIPLFILLLIFLFCPSLPLSSSSSLSSSSMWKPFFWKPYFHHHRYVQERKLYFPSWDRKSI